ncbi:sugar ABC transporter substrate-binding protein, partial [Streptomyces sp. BE303]|nr:sugar ABC transporter substrate-binding protein [Streptomyces sp. BE303]MED7950199.1 sugar ABC transporter substrate-binding protein [Streptomyces sp. BE303]
MFRSTSRTVAAAGLLLALGLTTACSTGQEAASGSGEVAKVDGKISITYLQKQGDQEYFVGEAAG